MVNSTGTVTVVRVLGRNIIIAAAASAGVGLAAAALFLGGDGGEPPADASQIVIEVGAYRGPLEGCLARQNSPTETSGCVRELAREATGVGAWGAALAMLRESVERHQDMVGRCHNETHLVGEALYDAGTPLEVLYAVPFPDCRFGFYHGGLTSHTRDMDLEELSAALPSLCAFFGNELVPATQECVHVLGHFIFDRAGTDLPAAFERCMEFIPEELRSRCVDGVLMQAVDTVRPAVVDRDHPARPVLDRVWGADRDTQRQRVLEVCAQLGSASAAYVCYTNISQAATVLWEKDFPAVHELCLALDSRWHRPCFEGIAASGFASLDWDASLIADACHASDSPATVYCIGSMAFTFGLQDSPARAAEVCELARPYERDACTEGVERGIKVRSSLWATTS